jgi:hypothetical protein
VTAARYRIELAPVLRGGRRIVVPSVVVSGPGGRGSVYVARLDGLHPMFGYVRTFLGERIRGTHRKQWSRVTVPLEDLRDGDILEIQSGETRRFRFRDYFAVRGGSLVPLPESKVREIFAERAASYGSGGTPSPTSLSRMSSSPPPVPDRRGGPPPGSSGAAGAGFGGR